MAALKDRLERNVIPGLLISLSTVDAPARFRARRTRSRGGSGRVELYFAFDDPQSAYALIELAELVEGRDVAIECIPVVDRGIEGDPAAERKRAYAVDDARRLFRRRGEVLSRTEPLNVAETAFLAEWAAGAPQAARLTDFCVAAMREIWLDGDGPVDRQRLRALWLETVGGDPDATASSTVVNEKRLRRRKMYEVPAAWISGRWFFAHERIPQIGEWLDRLGWGDRR